MKLAAVRLAWYRALVHFLPETRGFACKARLLRWCGARVGQNVRICSSAMFFGTGALEIGDDVWIGHGAFIASNASVRIGSCVDIGPQVFLGTGTHEIDPTGPHSAGPGINLDVEIGAGVWLGARAVVLPGVKIGAKAVAAAGAVVTQDVPERCLVGGVPARVLRTLPPAGADMSAMMKPTSPGEVAK